MDTVYVVICKPSRGPWMPCPSGVFGERRLAENLIECRIAAGDSLTHAIVEGPAVLTPAAKEN